MSMRVNWFALKNEVAIRTLLFWSSAMCLPRAKHTEEQPSAADRANLIHKLVQSSRGNTFGWVHEVDSSSGYATLTNGYFNGRPCATIVWRAVDLSEIPAPESAASLAFESVDAENSDEGAHDDPPDEDPPQPDEDIVAELTREALGLRKRKAVSYINTSTRIF